MSLERFYHPDLVCFRFGCPMFVKLDETRALPGAFVQIYLQLLKRTSGQVRIMFLFNLISLITNQMMQFIRTCHTLY